METGMEAGKREVVKGGVELPIGYRFRPTDEELIVHYLLRKAFAFPLPASVIPVFDVFSSHPRNFTGEGKEKDRYFFCRKTKQHLSNRLSACEGYWKATGVERQITASGKTVGMRRTLAFFESDKSPINCNKTRWVMREYCLVGSASAIAKMFGMGSGEWAVYSVFQRRRSKAVRSRERDGHVSCIDFTLESAGEIPPPPPSSAGAVILTLT
ncbi:PREDICTED: NAC domain-containing protein 41 [Tarenaya hassleriana]|uniref:NAC domain-containing protein 41 n=1 Tax=Tarenaya hassleriana TaxID=28532 RepID=UPI00053C7249|nr:PREDICTED: NAC domain-containing protein 41 [Tarenaya hassleriana]